MKSKNLLQWLARGLSLLISLAVYAFVFDLTPEDFEWPNVFLAAIPGTVLLLLTAVSWNFPKAGGLLLTLIGLLYSTLGWYRVSYFGIGIIGGGLMVTGLLFVFFGKIKIEKDDKKNRSIEDTRENSKKEYTQKFTEVKPKEIVSIEERINKDANSTLNITPTPQPIKTEELELEPILPEATIVMPQNFVKKDLKEEDTVLNNKENVPSKLDILDIPETEITKDDINSSVKDENLTEYKQKQELPELITTPMEEDIKLNDDNIWAKNVNKEEENITVNPLNTEEVSEPIVETKKSTPIKNELETSEYITKPINVPKEKFSDIDLPPLIKKENSIEEGQKLPELSIFDQDEKISRNPNEKLEIIESNDSEIEGFENADLRPLDSVKPSTSTSSSETKIKLPKLNLVTNKAPTFEELTQQETLGKEQQTEPINNGIQPPTGGDFLKWFDQNHSSKDNQGKEENKSI